MNLNIINIYYQQWKMKKLSDREFGLIFFLWFHYIKYPNKKLGALIEQKLLVEALNECRFYKVKNKALIALKNWNSGIWKFKAIDYIPTPYEVLELQSQGIRPVSVIVKDDLTPILNREDCLEFFLHDLEHGYMFFNDNEKKRMQIEFFKNVHHSLKTKIWDDYLSDPNFKKNFYYLISDMNTHREHYRAYLNAIIPKNHIQKFEFLFCNS